MREYLQKKAFIYVSLVERPRLVSLFLFIVFMISFMILSRLHFLAQLDEK